MVRYGHCTVSARLDALTPRSYRARNALVGVRSTAEPKKSPSMSAAHSMTDLCVRVRQTDRQTDRRFSRHSLSSSVSSVKDFGPLGSLGVDHGTHRVHFGAERTVLIQ